MKGSIKGVLGFRDSGVQGLRGLGVQVRRVWVWG